MPRHVQPSVFSQTLIPKSFKYHDIWNAILDGDIYWPCRVKYWCIMIGIAKCLNIFNIESKFIQPSESTMTNKVILTLESLLLFYFSNFELHSTKIMLILKRLLLNVLETSRVEYRFFFQSKYRDKPVLADA